MEQKPESGQNKSPEEINKDLEFMTELIEQRTQRLLENLQKRKLVTHPTEEATLLIYAADEATNIRKLIESMIIVVKKKPLG